MDILPRDSSLETSLGLYTAPSSACGDHAISAHHFRATQRLRSYSATHASEALLPSSTSPATRNLSVCDSDAPTSACMNILPSRASRKLSSGNTSPPPAISKSVKPELCSLKRRSRVMSMGNSQRPTFHDRVRTQGLVIEAMKEYPEPRQSTLYLKNAINPSRPRIPLTDIPDSNGSIRPHLRPGAASNSTLPSFPKRFCRIFEPTLDVVDINNIDLGQSSSPLYPSLTKTPSNMLLAVDQQLEAFAAPLKCTDLPGLPQDMLNMCAQLEILAAQVHRMDVPSFDITVKFPHNSGIDVTPPSPYFQNRHFPSLQIDDNEDATRVLLGRQWPTNYAGLDGDRLDPDQAIMEVGLFFFNRRGSWMHPG